MRVVNELEGPEEGYADRGKGWEEVRPAAQRIARALGKGSCWHRAQQGGRTQRLRC